MYRILVSAVALLTRMIQANTLPSKNQAEKIISKTD